jgi:alpha-L-rhamnosidase
MVIPYFKAYYNLMTTQGFETCAAWGDVSVIAPWIAYNIYGDRRIMEENFDPGKKWLAYVSSAASATTSDDDKADEDLKHLWRAVAFHFADWLTPSMTTVDRRGIYTFDSGSITKELVTTMYYAYSSELLSKMPGLLGRHEGGSQNMPPRQRRSSAPVERPLSTARDV